MEAVREEEEPAELQQLQPKGETPKLPDELKSHPFSVHFYD